MAQTSKPLIALAFSPDISKTGS